MAEIGAEIFLLLSRFLLLNGQNTWDEADSSCKQRSMSLQTITVTNNYNIATQYWTPNYLLHFSCIRDFEISNRTIVLSPPLEYTNQDFKCRWDYRPQTEHPNTLLTISSEPILRQAVSKMKMGNKYWITGIDLHICSFRRLCEKMVQTNGTRSGTKRQKTFTDCKEKNPFICGGITDEKIAISLIKVWPDAFREWKYSQDNEERTPSVYYIPTVLAFCILAIGFGVTCLLSRHWVVKLKAEIERLKEMGFTQPTYNADEVDMIQSGEPEPQTPISPSGTSLYENFMNSSEEARPEITVSYRTSTQVEQTVEVKCPPINLQNPRGNEQFKMALRTPPRGHGIKHKSLENSDKERKGQMMQYRQTSTEPRTSTVFQLDYKNCLRGMPNEWFKTSQEILGQKPSPRPYLKSAAKSNDPKKLKGRINVQTCDKASVAISDTEPDDYESIWEANKKC